MYAVRRTYLSSRSAIVSNDKNAGNPAKVLTEWPFEICRALGPRQATVPQKGHILVFESDDLILGLLERWLDEAGYAVFVEAPQRLPQSVGDRGEPLLVIIDVPMPRKAEKTIRSVREVYGGPILLLSARFRRGTGASSDVARQLGVRRILPKPFTRSELLSAVVESIDGR
jgi:CheY-like chemotaxis protein